MQLKIRTVTVFVVLEAELVRQPVNFGNTVDEAVTAKDDEQVLLAGITTARRVQQALEASGYTVQTVRIATNPFPEWLIGPTVAVKDYSADSQAIDACRVRRRLKNIATLLEQHTIDACAFGPAQEPWQLNYCVEIIQLSSLFSCSATLSACDTKMAQESAKCILELSVHNPLDNFRFCVAAASTQPHIPFFPVATTSSLSSSTQTTTSESPSISSTSTRSQPLRFAIGLENGELLGTLLQKHPTLQKMHLVQEDLMEALAPIIVLCQQQASVDLSHPDHNQSIVEFLGIDTSANPSLDASGSVAAALEQLNEVTSFGGPGTLAAAAALTTMLQRLPLPRIGYCGLMLPLCEDIRLAELAANDKLRITDLLSISQVCGVGVDTVPIPGDVSVEELTGLLLDVAGLGARWNKSLSCRVFPVPGKKAGEWTMFDFPHVVNTKILPLK